MREQMGSEGNRNESHPEILKERTDRIGKPIHQLTMQKTLHEQSKHRAEVIREDLKQHPLEGPEALSLEQRALDQRIRALRVERDRDSGFWARFIPARQRRIEGLQREIEETTRERDRIVQRIEALLPAPLPSRRTKTERRESAREIIKNTVITAFAGRQDYRAGIPRRNVLREDRARLVRERETLRFWHWGRKQEIDENLQRIDREMSYYVNSESPDINA